MDSASISIREIAIITRAMRMNINQEKCEFLGKARFVIAPPPASANRGHKKIENCTISGAYLVLPGWLLNRFNKLSVNKLSVVYFINNQ